MSATKIQQPVYKVYEVSGSPAILRFRLTVSPALPMTPFLTVAVSALGYALDIRHHH